MEWLKRLIDRHAISDVSSSDLPIRSAEASRDADPRSFSIPRREQRISRQVGDEVMVFVQSPEAFPNDVTVGENVWVKITEKRANHYVAVAEDGLKLFPQMATPVLEFGPECIAGVQLPSTHVLPYMKACLVSKSVLEADAWPTKLHRIPTESDDDSGWRICADDEPITEATESVLVHQVIAKFQVLDSVLDEPNLANWTWQNDLNEYQRQPAAPLAH